MAFVAGSLAISPVAFADDDDDDENLTELQEECSQVRRASVPRHRQQRSCRRGGHRWDDDLPTHAVGNPLLHGDGTRGHRCADQRGPDSHPDGGPGDVHQGVVMVHP